MDASPSRLRASIGGMPAPPHVSLVTWNVQRAAEPRAHAQMSWLVGQPAADVVVLTELPQTGSAHADALPGTATAWCARPPAATPESW
jgi:hypothetical protein